jgi:hypothetical protein
MLNQKLLVVKTEATKKGMAIILPAMHTQALNIGFPFPNLSLINPPVNEDINPHIKLIREYTKANSAFLSL